MVSWAPRVHTLHHKRHLDRFSRVCTALVRDQQADTFAGASNKPMLFQFPVETVKRQPRTCDGNSGNFEYRPMLQLSEKFKGLRRLKKVTSGCQKLTCPITNQRDRLARSDKLNLTVICDCTVQFCSSFGDLFIVFILFNHNSY